MADVMQLEQPALGQLTRSIWKDFDGKPRRTRAQLSEASGLGLARLANIEKGRDLKTGDQEALARGLAQLGWLTDQEAGSPAGPDSSQAGEGDPPAPFPATQPTEDQQYQDVLESAKPCGPCEAGHHSACRSAVVNLGPEGGDLCCDGNLVFGRVPWQDAEEIIAERERAADADVILLLDEEELGDPDDFFVEVDAVPFAEGVLDPEAVADTFRQQLTDAGRPDLAEQVRIIEFPGEPEDGTGDANAVGAPGEPEAREGIAEAPVGTPWPDDGVTVMTQGQVATAQRCWRKWWLGFYRSLATAQEDFGSYRATGDRVHRALAAWYVADSATRVDPRDALERAIVEDWTKLRKQQSTADGIPLDLLDENPTFLGVAKKFQDACNLERAMVEGYVQWIEETGRDQGLQIIASETPLWADLELQDDEDTKLVRAVGLLDTRVYRHSDGVRLFFDHKTVGDLASPTQGMVLNQQMKHYSLLEFLNTPEGEARCDGALYNMLRRVKRTDRARPPFYDRVEVRHNIHELNSWKRQLAAWSLEILDRTRQLDNGRHHLDVVPPTPILGSGPNSCKATCDFFNVCPLFDDGSRADDALADNFVKVDTLARYGIR